MSIVCGNRAHDSLRDYLGTADAAPGRKVQVHHATVDEVRRCYATKPDGHNYFGGLLTLEDLDLKAEAEAEARAEEGYERWLEDGGPHAAAIQASYALDEEMERRNGVVPFDEAMAAAEFAHADERMWS